MTLSLEGCLFVFLDLVGVLAQLLGQSGLMETRTSPHAQPMVLHGIFRPSAVKGKQRIR
jgi:hypothetical protein